MQRSIAQLEHTTIVSDGERVRECRDGDTIGDVMQSGAAVFGISVAALWHGIEASLEMEPSVDVYPDGKAVASTGRLSPPIPFEELAAQRMRERIAIHHAQREHFTDTL